MTSTAITANGNSSENNLHDRIVLFHSSDVIIATQITTELTMRHVLLLIASMLCLAFPAMAQQQERTLKSEMEFLHQEFGVNFVYDSSIDLEKAYSGKPMKEVARDGKNSHDKGLMSCLMALFENSGVDFEIMKKYIVLTKEGSKKKPKDYTILIEEQHDTINESVVTALLNPEKNETQTGLKRITSKDLNSGFALFSTPDVIKTLQMMPGVSSGTELLSGFYVHGGDGSDNLFLLDGVPIYQVSHLAGLFSSFNTDVIGSLDFYKSGFPARYGSKMSSVVDVNTKEGSFNDFHGTFAIGLIDGRFQLEGPLWKGKTSFNVGLRRTWTETLTLPIFAVMNKFNRPDKQNARYAFSDFNAKITHKFSETNRLSANFYTGRDALRYLNDNLHEHYDENNEVISERDVVDIAFSWGNILGSLNWDYEISDRMSVRNIAYYSGSYSSLSFSNQETDSRNNSVTAGEYNTSNVHNMGLKSDWFYRLTPKQKLRYGATLQYHIYCPDATARTDYAYEGVNATTTAYADTLRYNTLEASLYAEDEIAFTDDISMNAGLRYTLYSAAGKTWHSLEPRVAMKYRINDRLAAKASYTEMSQPTHLVSSMYIDLPTNAWLPSTAKIRPSRSREVAAGIYSNLGHHIHLNVEGWYKHMHHLIEYAGSYSVFPPLTGWEECYKTGMGRSWGAELDFGFDNGRTQANVYYTLSWSQRKFDDFYHSWYKDRNDNRHKLTVMAKHKFGKRFELYGAWNYHSGNRITLASHDINGGEIDLYTEPNNVNLPDYHRLDLGFNFIKTTKRGNTSIWNISVYNAYCRMNPITAFIDSKGMDGTVLSYYGSAAGIIPIIPTFSYTLKF